MNNVISIFKNSKTKENHDTMRQVSRSETPSGLIESLIHIARAQQPVYWSHNCQEYQGKNRRLEAGQICPVCSITQDGISYKRKD